METHACKTFETKGTYCYKHANFTFKTFINIPRIYTSQYHKNIKQYLYPCSRVTS